MIKKLLLALTIFIITFCSLGQFYNRWWFNGADDFHLVHLASKTQTLQNSLYFLRDGHPLHDAGPSNCDRSYHKTSFMNTYYRPIQLMASTWLYWVFGTQAYGFFLFNVVIHALNTALLFLLYTYCASVPLSFCASLFFAFHPQIAYRFGALANIQYYLGTFFIVLMLLMSVRILRTDRFWLVIPMSIIFFLALLCREVYIVLPAIMLVLSPCLDNKNNWRLPLGPLFGLSCTALVYLSLRLYLYPLDFGHGPLHFNSIIALARNKIPELLVCLYDSLWLSWLPWGNKLFKMLVLTPVLILLATLFLGNTKKLWVLSALISAGLMLWPGLIGHYSPRYFYDMAPFVLLAYVFLFTYYAGPCKNRYRLAQACSLLPCAFFILFSLHSFDRRATKLHFAGTAIENLLNNPSVKNRALCFLSYPADVLGDQPAEICWALRKEHTIPVYCDTITSLVQADANIIQPTKWINLVSEYHDKNYVTITQANNTIRYTSHNSKKILFLDNPSGYSLGKKIIHAPGTDFTLIINEQYRAHNPVYVVWDYETKEFRQRKHII